MSIDESRERIITFVVLSVDPIKRGPMRNWYRPESPTSISIKLNPANDWRVIEYRWEGDEILWTYGGRTHAWKRVPPDEYPDWLDAQIAAQYLKMDEMEYNA